MPKIDNKILYNKVKAEADSIYKKASAYKSGWKEVELIRMMTNPRT